MTNDSRRCRLSGLSLPLAGLHSPAGEEEALLGLAARRLGVSAASLSELKLIRKSLDARDKGRPAFVYTLEVTASGPCRGAEAPREQSWPIPLLRLGASPRPIVVGAGPAGLFAAWYLASAGLRPLVLEQGRPVEQREADVGRFWSQGQLEPYSNIQYGEGGAGAFSDGKLTSRGKDSRGQWVLRLLAECGAPPQILYWHKPHIGSDKLPAVVAELRRRIMERGGDFRYSCRLTDISLSGGALRGLTVVNEKGCSEEIEAAAAILATGNGGRQVYELLARRGLAVEAKAFAVGLRICHKQSMIDKAQYGAFAGHPLLGAADYQLTWHDDRYDRGCYTFCNCPGGQVVNASSSPEGLVVNGASPSGRDGGWANAAVVAQVAPGRDFGSGPLDGLDFQSRLERAAYQAGGHDHGVPIMSVAAFMGREDQGCGDLSALCSWASRETDLGLLLPEDIISGLKGALAHWERIIPGFGSSGWLAAVESRTSAPVRVLRGGDGASLNCRGLYPAGEGAGYAGGIVSSAADGLRAAQALGEGLG